jgi:hypothetical protein
VLSDIQAYNVLANMCVNSQSSSEYMRFLQSTAGASSSATPETLASTYVVPTAPATAGAPTAGEINTHRTANVASASHAFNVLDRAVGDLYFTESKKYYSIPLISGFLNSSRFIPLGLIGGSGLVLEMFLESNFASVFNGPAYTGTQTYSVSDVEFIGKIVAIEDEKADAMIRAMWQTHGLKIKCSDWQSHFNTISAGQGSATVTIPDRAACLKSLSTVLTSSAPTHNVSGIHSYKHNNSSFQYRIGSTLYPNQECSVSSNNLLESLSEHMKAFNSGIFNLSSNTLIRPSSWGNDSTYTQLGTYAMTYDFESYSESPDLYSGIDTSSGLPITLNMRFSVNTPAVLNLITFSHKDVVYSINPDGTITKFE